MRWDALAYDREYIKLAYKEHIPSTVWKFVIQLNL